MSAGTACLAADNKATICALCTIATAFFGYVDVVGLAMAGMVITDQKEIGAAIGITASIRSGISTVATAVYTTVLSNRLGKNIPAIVPPALIKAGLPVSSVAAWLSANTVGTPMAFASVKGNNPAIMAAGVHAFKMASAQAYRTVFLTTLAFWGVGLGLTFFTPNADPHMTSNVATTLHKRNDTEIVALKEVDNTAEA